VCSYVRALLLRVLSVGGFSVSIKFHESTTFIHSYRVNKKQKTKDFFKMVLLVSNSAVLLLVIAATSAFVPPPQNPNIIYTILDMTAWKHAQETGWYDGGAEAKQKHGVIHCCTGNETLFVLDSYYTDVTNVSVAKIDVSKVQLPARVVWVNTEPTQPPFPHIQNGSLSIYAVDSVVSILHKKTGTTWKENNVCSVINCTEVLEEV